MPEGLPTPEVGGWRELPRDPRWLLPRIGDEHVPIRNLHLNDARLIWPSEPSARGAERLTLIDLS